MPSRTLYERIRTTLDTYDPTHTTVCVGGAALALQFCEYGWPAEVGDVDVLASQDYINQLNQRLVKDHVEGNAWADPFFNYSAITESGERSMSLVPKDEVKARLMKFQTFTTIKDSRHTAVYQEDLPTVDVNGIKCLDAGEILLWKSQLMRKTDREALRYALINPKITEALGDVSLHLKKMYEENERLL